MRRLAAVTVAAIVTVPGCVKINTQTTYSEEFVEQRSSVTLVPSSLQYQSTASVDGAAIAVVIKQDEHCKSAATPVFRKTAHYTRAPEGTSFFRPLYVALYGVTALGAGAGLYLDADNLAANSMSGGNSTSGNSPSDYRNTGLLLGAIGVGLLTLATIDQVRLRDTNEDLGTVLHDPTVSEAVCHERPTSNQKVALRVDSSVDWRLDGNTDSAGAVRFTLQDIPEAAFHGGDVTFKIEIGDRAVPVPLVDGAAEKLLGTLAGDPTSRIARDREAKAKAMCDAAIAKAREAQQEIKSKPDEVLTAWNSAKKACAPNWSDDREQELVKAGAAVHDVRLDQKSRAFDDALAAAITKDHVAVDELKRAEKTLTELGELQPPDPQLAARTKKLEATRRRAVDKLVALANRYVAAGDIDHATESLTAADSISPNDPRVDRIDRALKAKIDAQAKQEEADRARKEGPYWHLQVICGGREQDGTWQRGWSGADAKHTVCVNRCPKRDDGNPQQWCMDKCMNGAGNDICEWRATKVKCYGCE